MKHILLIIPTYLLGLLSITMLLCVSIVVAPYYAGVHLLRGRK